VAIVSAAHRLQHGIVLDKIFSWKEVIRLFRTFTGTALGHPSNVSMGLRSYLLHWPCHPGKIGWMFLSSEKEIDFVGGHIAKRG
jgi:hypothetical protein